MIAISLVDRVKALGPNQSAPFMSQHRNGKSVCLRGGLTTRYLQDLCVKILRSSYAEWNHRGHNRRHCNIILTATKSKSLTLKSTRCKSRTACALFQHCVVQLQSGFTQIAHMYELVTRFDIALLLTNLNLCGARLLLRQRCYP